MIEAFKCFSRLWITIIFFTLIGSLCSCEDKEAISRQAAINNANAKVAFECSMKGGIVIYDKDGHMTNCVFPPEPAR